MRILFVENRYKTYFFELIANLLSKKGYEIHWIIQNKEFTPKGNFYKHVIPYPSNKKKVRSKNASIEAIIKLDRQHNHFHKKKSNYFYYYNDKIEQLVKEINPQIVFGEATTFHELLIILNCKKINILYLNPSSCRYPVGRFSFYRYDTLDVFKGSGEILPKTKAAELIDQIIYRKTLPDYMSSIQTKTRKKVNDRLKKVVSYIRGERFNTPHPIIKYRLEKQKKKNILNWDKSALKKIDNVKEFLVLYPLQMQPEANIDVWGKKHRDQEELIKKLSESLPVGATLIVKPNPKSNYELTDELTTFVNKKKNIQFLHHNVKMDDIIPKIDLVITVTGTIAIECVLMNKPVVTLVKTINNKSKNCIYMESIEKELKLIVEKVLNGDFPKLKNHEKIDFINVLNRSSYKGKISDPYNDPTCTSEENINDLFCAFDEIIKHNG
ncbi:MAG: hypothetical protein JXQ93_08500 [Flavobacteriaceae bacterium]